MNVNLSTARGRKQAIGWTIEIEVARNGRPVLRRGVLNRASGNTFWLDDTCYHISEVRDYREIRGPGR